MNTSFTMSRTRASAGLKSVTRTSSHQVSQIWPVVSTVESSIRPRGFWLKIAQSSAPSATPGSARVPSSSMAAMPTPEANHTTAVSAA